MKKRAVSSLLAILAVVSFILPALATEPGEETEIEETSAQDSAEETEPESAIFLDGVSQPLEYEILNGTTYVTVASFVAVMDPEAVVEEENGVATVSSARVEEIVDDEAEDPANVEVGTADDEIGTANVVQETLSMTVSDGARYIVANSRYLYAQDGVIMLNDRVAAPIRALAKVFNLGVDYDAEAKAILLNHVEDAGAYLQPGDSYYNEDTLFWLSRIIYAESGNQILDGKIAVGNVVMNRVESPQFPNNIYDVLNQKNQFSPASSLSKKTPNSQSELAAKLVMDGAQVVPSALFFARAGMSCYASRNRTYVTTIGAHAFYA